MLRHFRLWLAYRWRRCAVLRAPVTLYHFAGRIDKNVLWKERI